jgi:hypothetical protein
MHVRTADASGPHCDGYVLWAGNWLIYLKDLDLFDVR